VTYRYSVDLGGDLDLSDPGNQGNEWMDCGDVYVESAPTLVKDDTGPVGAYTGYPLLAAPQPTPAQIGNMTTADYDQFFDLDAEDQIGIEVYQPTGPTFAEPGAGLYLNPTVLHLSFEDDGPNGWAVSGDVPTTAAPARGTSGGQGEIVVDQGLFGSWSPTTITGVRDEAMLGLAANPPDDSNDDDVDALDIEEHQYFYWSPDHEANMGLDPGDIYLTDRLAAGQNTFLALDDVNHIGVVDSTDVDAWEFCLVFDSTYQQLFGGSSGVATAVIGLFSVDDDDLDTVGVDESGGLNPNQIYATNLLGTAVGLAIYDEDVDAIAVPEPACIGLLTLGGLALLRRRRK
jgi:hypothetical protein